MSRNFKRVGPDCQSGRKDGGTRLSRPTMGKSCPSADGPNLNRVFILLCFLALSCVLGKAGNATNEVVNAVPPVVTDEKASDTGALLPASPIRPWRDFAGRAQRGEQGERDPFWPIGYVPPPKPGGTLDPAKSVDPAMDKKTAFQAAGLSEMLKIGGVTKTGGKFYAIINGFTVQTGEVVIAVADGEVYKFVVEKIDFKKVQIKPIK